MNGDAFIIAAARTPVAPYGGALRDVDYDALAEAPINRCLVESGIPSSQVDELILSNALGAGGNPARVAALRAGLPTTIAGLSIDRQCVGGLDAILLARVLIQSGQAHVVLSGGSESYSLRPERRYRADWNSEPVVRDQARFTPWENRDPHMSQAASDLAAKHNIGFTEQNDWAMESHAKAVAAAERLTAEIVNPDGIELMVDPFTRLLTSPLCERAPKLVGTITSANSSVSADGAAMLMVVSHEVLKQVKPAFALRIVGGATLGGDPMLPGIAPVDAIRRTLAEAHTDCMSLSVIEIMEAYAAQAIACVNVADLDRAKINLGGGSLARGHPIGASGAILAVRLFSELQRIGGFGLAAIAAAGGLGTAMIVEAVTNGKIG